MSNPMIEGVQWRLSKTEGTSFKFYEAFAFRNGRTVLRYGRIGTQGQPPKVTDEINWDRALAVAKRQAYKKQSEGYQMEVEEFAFTIEEWRVTYEPFGTMEGHALSRLAERQRESGGFTQQQSLVTTHYDQLTERVQTLLTLANAPDGDLGDVMEQWGDLEKAWRELTEKHAQAKVTFEMAEQTVVQKLMG